MERSVTYLLVQSWKSKGSQFQICDLFSPFDLTTGPEQYWFVWWVPINLKQSMADLFALTSIELKTQKEMSIFFHYVNKREDARIIKFYFILLMFFCELLVPKLLRSNYLLVTSLYEI